MQFPLLLSMDPRGVRDERRLFGVPKGTTAGSPRRFSQGIGSARHTGAEHRKDFWVTWTLDVLFNGLPDGHPRFLFKGGTSLSKAYELISRFSEDIDITVFREDIGAKVATEELEKLGKNARRR